MAQFTNQAILTYNGVRISSNVAVGEVTEVLTATKDATPETYDAGDRLTYIISIVNTGSTDVTGVSVSDNLGAYAFGEMTLYPLTYVDGSVKLYENGVIGTPPAVSGTAPVVFSEITVPVGGNVLIVYSAEANEYAPLGTGAVIENTATVSGNGISSIEATATVNADAGPDLSITKSVSPQSVAENGEVTYTILIQNFGGGAAKSDAAVTVTDTLDPILTDLTATLNGAPLEETTGYTYSETDGLFETVSGVVTVPAAICEQDPESGAWIITPGETTLTISGTI